MRILFALLFLIIAVGAPGCSGAGSAQRASRPASQVAPHFSVLVFSKTAGFRHASIPSGIRAIETLGERHHFVVEATENASVFTSDSLFAYEAVVFLNTTGDVLNAPQQQAFDRYIRGGGGFVGVHAAADTEYEWPFYGRLIGAYFEGHPSDPNVRSATVLVTDPAHPSTRFLPVRWTRTDEWYNYRSNSRTEVHVLATVDEETYEGGTMGEDHPIAWAHEYAGGRAWYTGGGHTKESYGEPLFLKHLLGGIEWAASAALGDVGATVWEHFEKVVLDSTVTDPIELAVAPDGRVFFIERRGAVKVWAPETQSTHLAGYLPVSTLNEDGMLGLTLDPNFPENHWLYLYYSPEGAEPKNVLARFTLAGGEIDSESKQVLLEVPTQREECCHTGGSLAFGPEGNLFISTGDNTNPFASQGFAPIDERPGREHWDAQRTAANTMDLRGKILRIRPLPDGTYEIPEGNLFPEGEKGRPEIYVMGNRNPYRISVDQKTGWLYWGDVGPDAGAPNPKRGPAGHDEINQAREAGNYGWPYFVANNKAYHDYNFATEESGPAFNPERPVNESPGNTGARVLPPAQPAMIWYPYGPSEEFPEMGVGGRTAMAGPVYHYDVGTVGPRGLPAYYDDTLFIYEWARGWIKEVKLDDEGHLLKISPFVPGMRFSRPMDVELGPKGRLFLIEWGGRFWGGPDAKIVRIDYYGSEQRPPVAAVQAEPTSGPVPLQVTFSAERSRSSRSRSRGGGPLRYRWDFDGDGAADARGLSPTHTYEVPGTRAARLTVIDSAGLRSTARTRVVAGNTAPSVSITWPPRGGVFDFGASIPYEVAVSDPEDEAIPAEEVVVQPYLGRDTHALPLEAQRGPTGVFRIRRDSTYNPKENLFGVLEARYTDEGTREAGPITTSARIRLQPRRKQAEYVTTLQGAQRQVIGDIRAGEYGVLLTATDGDYVSYAPVNLTGIDSLTFRLAPEAGGTIEVRLDAPGGRLLATVRIDSATAERATPIAEGTASTDAGGEHEEESADPASEVWTHVTVPVTDPGGTHELFLVFEGAGDKPLLKLDWLAFGGRGVMSRPAAGAQ